MFCIQDHPNLNPNKTPSTASTGDVCGKCQAPRTANDKFCSGCGAAV